MLAKVENGVVVEELSERNHSEDIPNGILPVIADSPTYDRGTQLGYREPMDKWTVENDKVYVTYRVEDIDLDSRKQIKEQQLNDLADNINNEVSDELMDYTKYDKTQLTDTYLTNKINEVYNATNVFEINAVNFNDIIK